MYSLLFKSFFRTKIFLVSLILVLGVGIISILIGKQYLIKQQENILAAKEFQTETINQNRKYHSDDLGLLLYYQRFAFMKQPANISAISIGQSDVNPLLQSVTIRGLEGQKYDTDFENPSLLMSGNLDLGFVIIYLIPLVLIAMTFNLYSEEKELGTWRILSAQTSGKVSYLLKKLMVRGLFIITLFTILMITASVFLKIPFKENFLGIFAQGLAYIFFWIALCMWVISYLKNSSFNAVILISSWVILTILVPALVNNYVINRFQVPEALNAMVEQRDGYHEKWDLKKDATMSGFLEAYPQYKDYEVPEDSFSWIWYYGMQHLGDLTAKETSAEMTEKIMLRTTVSSEIAKYIPTMHIQLSLNKLAGTDMESHLNYLQALTRFHESLRLGFYKKIFDEDSVASVHWDNYQAKFYIPERNLNWVSLLIPTLLITLIISILSVFNFRKL